MCFRRLDSLVGNPVWIGGEALLCSSFGGLGFRVSSAMLLFLREIADAICIWEMDQVSRADIYMGNNELTKPQEPLQESFGRYMQRPSHRLYDCCSKHATNISSCLVERPRIQPRAEDYPRYLYRLPPLLVSLPVPITIVIVIFIILPQLPQLSQCQFLKLVVVVTVDVKVVLHFAEVVVFGFVVVILGVDVDLVEVMLVDGLVFELGDSFIAVDLVLLLIEVDVEVGFVLEGAGLDLGLDDEKLLTPLLVVEAVEGFEAEDELPDGRLDVVVGIVAVDASLNQLHHSMDLWGSSPCLAV